MTKDEFRNLKVGDHLKGHGEIVSIENELVYDAETDTGGYVPWQLTFADHHTLRSTDAWIKNTRKVE
jgi:hypothetical protein